MIEPKTYPRDALMRGRVRVRILLDDGTPAIPQVLPRTRLLALLALPAVELALLLLLLLLLAAELDAATGASAAHPPPAPHPRYRRSRPAWS